MNHTQICQVFQVLVSANIFTNQDRESFLTKVSGMESPKEFFNYLLDRQGQNLNSKIHLAEVLCTNPHTRNIFKPELHYWILKIKIAEAFGAETDEEEILEVIVNNLGKLSTLQRKKMIGKLYQEMTGDKPGQDDISQIDNALSQYHHIFDQLEGKGEGKKNESIKEYQKIEGSMKEPKKVESLMEQNELNDIAYNQATQKRILQTNLDNCSQYLNQLREDIKEMPETVIDYKIRKAQIQLGQKYLQRQGEEPNLSTQIEQMVKNIEVQDKQGEKVKQKILEGEDIRRNLRILRRIVCGIDIMDMLRMIKKGRQEREKTINKVKNNGDKKIKVLLFFGLSKAGKTTLITRLMGYKMKKIKMEGIYTLQPENPQKMNNEHKELVIGYSNRSTTRYPKLYKVPTQCLPDDDDNEEYETYCMDSAGLEDSAGLQVEGSNRITMIELLQEVDKLQIIVVINQKNWGVRGADIEKLAKTTSSIIRDNYFSQIKKSVKFVFNNFDNEFKETFYANVEDLYKNILNQSSCVGDENFKQFFLRLKTESKTPEKMMAVDILSLKPQKFFQRIFSEATCIEQTSDYFVYDVGSNCKRQIDRLITRAKKAFHEEYKKGNIDGAQFYINLMEKIASERKLQSNAIFEISQMKENVEKSLDQSIKRINKNFMSLQKSTIRGQDNIKREFQELYENYKCLITQIDKFKQLEPNCKLDETLSGYRNELYRWYNFKASDWNKTMQVDLQQLIEYAINGYEFMKLFSPQLAVDFKNNMINQENRYRKKMKSEIENWDEEENQLDKHLKILYALQKAQGKHPSCEDLQQRISEMFREIKEKVTIIKLESKQVQWNKCSINQNREIASIQRLVEYIQAVFTYPKQLVKDHEQYKNIYQKIVIQAPKTTVQEFQKLIDIDEQAEKGDENSDEKIENIKNLVEKLYLLNQVKVIREHHDGKLLQVYEGLQDYIEISLKKFENIATSLNKNEPQQIKTNIQKLRKQIKKLQKMVKITNKGELITRFDQMKNELGESFRTFMNANDINENINFTNLELLCQKTFKKYNKLKEFEEIYKVIDSQDLKESMDSMIGRVESKIEQPIKTMMEQMKKRNWFNPNKLVNYLSYMSVLNNQGAYVLKPKFRQKISKIEQQMETQVKKIYHTEIAEPLQKLKSLLHQNKSLEQENLKNLMNGLSLNELETYRKPLQMITELDLLEEGSCQEIFFEDLDHQLTSVKEVFYSFKDSIEEKVESSSQINTLNQLKKIVNVLKSIEIREDQEKGFEELFQKITYKMKDMAEDERSSLKVFIEEKIEPSLFDAEKFQKVYRQSMMNQTQQGQKNRRRLEQSYEEYKVKVQTKLLDAKIQMCDVDEGYGKKILEFFRSINQYYNKLEIVKKAGENNPFDAPQYGLSQQQSLISYFQEKLLEYNKGIIEEFKYLTHAQMRERSKNLKEIEREISNLPQDKRSKLEKYKEELKTHKVDFLSQNLMRIKESRDKEIKELDQRNIFDKIDGNFSKILSCLDSAQKTKIQNLAEHETKNKIESLKQQYGQDYINYNKLRNQITQKTYYLDREIQQRLRDQLKKVEDSIKQEISQQQKKLQRSDSEMEHFLEYSKKMKKSNNKQVQEQLALILRKKCNEIAKKEPLLFLKQQVWNHKDDICSEDQPEKIINEFKDAEKTLLINIASSTKNHITKILDFYEKPNNQAEDNFYDNKSIVSGDYLRQQKFRQIVDYYVILRDKKRGDRILQEESQKRVCDLSSLIKNFFQKFIEQGKQSIDQFNSIKEDILGNKTIIEKNFQLIKEFQADFKYLSQWKQLKEASVINDQLNRIATVKEQLFGSIKEKIADTFTIYSDKIKDNSAEQDNERIDKFENNLKILNAIMNGYNTYLSPPQYINMEQIRRQIGQRKEAIKSSYKEKLQNETNPARTDKPINSYLNYVVRLLQTITSRNRIYLNNFDQTLAYCKETLETEVESQEKQLKEIFKQFGNHLENRNKEYNTFRKSQDDAYLQKKEKVEEQRDNKIGKIQDKHKSLYNQQTNKKEKEKIKQEWDSLNQQTINNYQNKLDKLSNSHLQLLNKKKKDIRENGKSTITRIIELLIRYKKLSGIFLINSRINDFLNRELHNFKNIQNFLKEIFIELEQSEISTAAKIIDEHPIFNKYKGEKFIQETKETNSAKYILDQMFNRQEYSITASQSTCFQRLYTHFEKQQKYWIQTFENTKSQMMISDLADKIKSRGKSLAKDHAEKKRINPKQKVQLLAKIFALWSISSSQEEGQVESEDFTVCYKAHAAQILCVIIILCMEENQSGSGPLAYNRLAQVKTGEGKSIVLATLSVYLALFGYEVHCACYSQILSDRDESDFQKLFKLCDVKNKIHYGIFQKTIKKILNQKNENENTEERFEQAIKEMLLQKPESFMSNFMKIWLNKNSLKVLKDTVVNYFREKFTFFNSDKKNRAKKILLIDEIDVLFNKEYYGDTFNQSIQLRDPSIVKLFRFIWAHKESIDYHFVSDSSQFKNVLQQFPSIRKILKNQLFGMLAALKTYKQQKYSIIDRKIMYKVQDSFEEVNFRYNTVYAYLEEFQKGNVSGQAFEQNMTISLCIAQFSYACLPQHYSQVLGVTGTLGCLPKFIKGHLADKYQIKHNQLYIIPSVYGKKTENRTIENPICVDREHLFTKVIQNINQKFNQERPILVFFRNKREMLEFYNYKEYQNFQHCTSFITEEHDRFQREQKIKDSSEPKQITLMTNSFIRGTDFKLYNKKAIKAGGFHAIVTYLIDNPADYIQATGRVARQGKNGSFVEIYNKGDLELLDISLEEKDPISLVKSKREQKQQKEKQSCEYRLASSKIRHDQTIKVFGDQNFCQEHLIIYVASKNKFPEIFPKSKKAKFVIMVDGTYSMDSLFSQLKILLQKIFDDTYKTLKMKKYPGLIEIQLVLYRNYNSPPNQLLEYSTFDSQGQDLKKFLNKIQVAGGWGFEAVEVGLQYVNSIPGIQEIIIIGDTRGNTVEQVQQKRNQYKQFEEKRLEIGMTPTSTESQLNKLKEKQIKVNSFYLRNTKIISEYFDEIANQTSGDAKYIDIYDKDASQQMGQFIVKRALEWIGKQDGISQQLIKEYQNILNKRLNN